MTQRFIIKIPTKKQLQQIASNHFSDIEFKSFLKLYKYYTREQFSFSENDITLS